MILRVRNFEKSAFHALSPKASRRLHHKTKEKRKVPKGEVGGWGAKAVGVWGWCAHSCWQSSETGWTHVC